MQNFIYTSKKMFRCIFILFITVHICGQLVIAHDVFTALPDMEALLKNELVTADIIDRYVKEEINRLEKLKQVANQYQVSVKSGLKKTACPVGSYLLMKQLFENWAVMENMIRDNFAENVLFNVSNHRRSLPVQFPKFDDLKGAAIALMRLQDVYNLDVKDLAQGKVQGLADVPEQRLSASDCYEFGRLAISRSDFYHSLIWLEEALVLLDKEDPPSVPRVQVLENLAFSMYQQGNVERATKFTEEWLQLEPHNERAISSMAYYLHTLNQHEATLKNTLKDFPPLKNKRQFDGSVKKQDVFEALCRGEFGPTEEEKSKLYCYYKNDRPFLKLAPLKVEIVHWKPKMILFRQIISDNEIEIIKYLITNQLQTATVVGKEGLEKSHVRTAKSGWLYSRDEITKVLNKRLDDMTDLDSKYSEDIHIVKYNIAGHYDPHYDFFNVPGIDESRKTENDRIATLIFYLSSPEAGGATAFPEINLTLFPTKNDAILWHNLFKNGSIDLNTRHGACAVLSGTKWVGNKWIRERGQEFLRKCGLDQYEYE